MDKAPFAYFNSDAAYFYMNSVLDYPARSALILVHSALLELTGKFPWRQVTDHLRPERALDELALYTAVANVFERPDEWQAMASEPVGTPASEPVVKARELAKSLPNEDAQNGLLAFINTFVAFAPAGQDIAFCCRLLIPIIFNDEWLPRVLRGEIAQHSDEICDDFGKFVEGWS